MELEIVLPDESPEMDVRTLVDLSRAAEELGYTTAWLPDHLLPPDPYGPTYGGVYEPLVTIGHLAAVTQRLRLGTSVLVAPLRDPFLLAKQVATLHQLSAGRIVLGLGVGWSEPEFDALGADFRSRGAATDDTLALLRHLFAGGQAPYRGRRFSYDHGVFAPVPDGRVPIMVGGNSDVALRRAARAADVWQGLPASPRAYAERVGRLSELVAEERENETSNDGRDVVPAVRIGWDETTTVARLADDVAAYCEAGAARVAVHLGPHETTRERMETLIATLPTS